MRYLCFHFPPETFTSYGPGMPAIQGRPPQAVTPASATHRIFAFAGVVGRAMDASSTALPTDITPRAIRMRALSSMQLHGCTVRGGLLQVYSGLELGHLE